MAQSLAGYWANGLEASGQEIGQSTKAFVDNVYTQMELAWAKTQT